MARATMMMTMMIMMKLRRIVVVASIDDEIPFGFLPPSIQGRYQGQYQKIVNDIDIRHRILHIYIYVGMHIVCPRITDRATVI